MVHTWWTRKESFPSAVQPSLFRIMVLDLMARIKSFILISPSPLMCEGKALRMSGFSSGLLRSQKSQQSWHSHGSREMGENSPENLWQEQVIVLDPRI